MRKLLRKILKKSSLGYKNLIKSILEIFDKNRTDEPPYEYNFLYSLKKSEYQKYLKKIYKYKTGENLNLKHPKTFNEKIQWFKLNGVTPLIRDCTDKVKVRDYVLEKIGEEYLKPVLQIIPNESKETMRCHYEQVNDNSGLARQSTDRCNQILDCHADIKMSSSARLRFPKFQFRENWVLAEYNDREPNDVSAYFDKIDFDKLPDSFVIKTNHGCKWQYIIKNKEEYLKNKRLFDITRKQMTGWLEQDYSFWNGFEMNYHGIEPKILIECLMLNNSNKNNEAIQVYCFYGIPKLILRIEEGTNNKTTLYNEKLNIIDDVLSTGDEKVNKPPDKLINQSFDLSKKLCKDFNFVRVDWMVFKNSLYFEELTFTPYSGYCNFTNQINKKFSHFINRKAANGF